MVDRCSYQSGVHTQSAMDKVKVAGRVRRSGGNYLPAKPDYRHPFSSCQTVVEALPSKMLLDRCA